MKDCNYRKDLKNIGDENRNRFQATVSRFGTKNGWRGRMLPTVLLINITYDNKIVADHIWINKTKTFDDANIEVGDIIEFEARVKEYIKGYFGYDFIKQLEHPAQKDFTLERLTRFRIITKHSKTNICDLSNKEGCGKI